MSKFKFCCVIAIFICAIGHGKAKDSTYIDYDNFPGNSDPGSGKPPPKVAENGETVALPLVPYTRRTFNQQQTMLVGLITKLNLDPSTTLKEPTTNMFKILRMCSEIFKKNVDNDLVLHKIISNSLTAFQLLFEGLDTNKLATATFTDIVDTLTKCDDGVKLQFSTASCPVEIQNIITQENGTSTLHTPVIPESRKFKELENDLIVEVNWKVFDFCHSRCFNYFRPQYNSFHYMAYEMEKMMEKQDIQERWFRNTGGIDYLKGIIAASNLMLKMRNLDYSVSAAHLTSKYKVWLTKPGLLKYRS